MNDLSIDWLKCQNDVWCSFDNLQLDNEHFNDLNGVYIIWSASIRKVVRIGSGIIKNRIAEHRENKEITQYTELKVTWAKVNKSQMEGVEKFLADTYEPLVGERFPDRMPISVNLPWQKKTFANKVYVP
jgi:hypothetical protein